MKQRYLARVVYGNRRSVVRVERSSMVYRDMGDARPRFANRLRNANEQMLQLNVSRSQLTLLRRSPPNAQLVWLLSSNSTFSEATFLLNCKYGCTNSAPSADGYAVVEHAIQRPLVSTCSRKECIQLSQPAAGVRWGRRVDLCSEASLLPLGKGGRYGTTPHLTSRGESIRPPARNLRPSSCWLDEFGGLLPSAPRFAALQYTIGCRSREPAFVVRHLPCRTALHARNRTAQALFSEE
jgi:hypothetical protein